MYTVRIEPTNISLGHDAYLRLCGLSHLRRTHEIDRCDNEKLWGLSLQGGEFVMPDINSARDIAADLRKCRFICFVRPLSEQI